MKKTLSLMLCLLMFAECAVAEETDQSPIGQAVQSLLQQDAESDPDDIALEGIAEEPVEESTEEPVEETEPAQEEQEESTDAAIVYEDLKKGAKGDMVTALQQRLTDLGIMTGKVDGDYGSITQKAIQCYFAWIGETGDGKSISASQLEKLLNTANSCYTKDYTVGDEEDAVLYIETMLVAYNCFVLEADDEFTEDTAEAVKVFQQANGLTESGIVDKATLDVMTSGKANKAQQPALVSLKKGDKGNGVLALQNSLIRLGFLSAPGDGDYGSATATAIKKASGYLEGLDKTGTTCSVEAQQIIEGTEGLYVKTVVKSSKNAEALRVEKRLNALGYLSRGNADGQIWKKTVTAIENFQQENGLEVNGKADEATQKVLFSDEAKVYPSNHRVVVSIEDQVVYVYERQEDASYKLVREMICSTGLNDKTPTGIFVDTPLKGDSWHHFKDYACWARYTFRIEGNILFHSVLFSKADEKYVYKNSVANLGKKASHGCIRLSVEDAKYLYDNLEEDVVIEIRETTGKE